MLGVDFKLYFDEMKNVRTFRQMANNDISEIKQSYFPSCVEKTKQKKCLFVDNFWYILFLFLVPIFMGKKYFKKGR